MATELGTQKNQLLQRLARVGELLVTDRTQDYFSLMSVSECRDYVQQVETFMRTVSRPPKRPF